MDYLIQFLTAINWELIIAFISLFLSVFAIISNALRSKEKYNVSIIDYKFIGPDILQLLIGLTNQSDSPLIIKSIFCNGFECELESKPIKGIQGKLNFSATPNFPVCIPSHGCQYVYLEFLDYKHTAPGFGTTLTLEICSTRHAVQKNLLLGHISHYLHTREQYKDFLDHLEKK